MWRVLFRPLICPMSQIGQLNHAFLTFLDLECLTALPVFLGPRLYQHRATNAMMETKVQMTIAVASEYWVPRPHGQPCTGPTRERKSAGSTIGSQASRAVHPQGRSSFGVCRVMLDEKKLVPEKTRTAAGTAMMKGTRSRVLGVAGSTLAPSTGCSRGTTVNRVRSKARPIASGMDRTNSTGKLGFAGRSWWSGVWVRMMSECQQ